MRKNLGCLLLVAGWVAACGTSQKSKPAAPPPAVVVPAPGPDDPYAVRPMTAAQLVELKARLGKLYKHMSRETVLQTIDLDSFHIHPFETANTTGIVYHFANGHTLVLSMERGDYDDSLKWASLDGELWPKEKEGVQRPLEKLDYDFSSPAQHH